MELGLANGLTMPYHAYAPLAAVTPTRDPVRVRVSSVTFCVQLKIYAAARRAAGGGGAGAGASPDTGTPWLAFYFILFALITSPATLLKNIFACWEISRSLFHAASLQSPLPASCPSCPSLPARQGVCKDMACHAAGAVVVLASAYVSLGLLMWKRWLRFFGCQQGGKCQQGKCAGKIA